VTEAAIAGVVGSFVGGLLVTDMPEKEAPGGSNGRSDPASKARARADVCMRPVFSMTADAYRFTGLVVI
jgi:hypothetical protein